MRVDLEALVAEARAAGAEEVILETNATLLDVPRARRLGEAGLTRARVNLPCWGDALDRITRDPGGFARARAGLEALAMSGIRVEVAAVGVRSTLPYLAALPALLAKNLGGAVRGIDLAVPVAGPDSSELVTYEEALAAVVPFALEASRAGVPASFRHSGAIPPCVLEPGPRGRLASLYSMSEATRRLDGHSQVHACLSCHVSDRCPGFAGAYLARHPLPPIHVIRGERARRQLTMTRPSYEQIERDFVSRGLGGENGGVTGESVVRINFHCNQACTFCFVARQLPPPRHESVRRAILEAVERGDAVALSGGEPTLHPRLLEYVKLAQDASPHAITLQTNAVRLDDPTLTAALVDAGLGHAFVSLHGATAEVAEAITRAPGTFPRTLAGVDNLVRSNVPTTVNFVLCAANAKEMTPAFELAAARWPGTRFNLSFVQASTDMVSRDRSLIPRYRDIAPHVRDLLRAAHDRGLMVIGFESMCGMPLCIVPEAIEARRLFDIQPDFDTNDFVKTDACARCAHHRRCWGIRRTYAGLYGTSELRPIPS